MSRFQGYMDEMCGANHSKGKKKRKRKGKIEESSNEKKEQMYQQGLYNVRSAFAHDFSQNYMKGMGLMMQSKSAVDPKYKKMRDAIATAYERLDDSISKHINVIETKAKQELKK